MTLSAAAYEDDFVGTRPMQELLLEWYQFPAQELQFNAGQTAATAGVEARNGVAAAEQVQNPLTGTGDAAQAAAEAPAAEQENLEVAPIEQAQNVATNNGDAAQVAIAGTEPRQDMEALPASETQSDGAQQATTEVSDVLQVPERPSGHTSVEDSSNTTATNNDISEEEAQSAYDSARDSWRSRKDQLLQSREAAKKALSKAKQLRTEQEKIERRLEEIKRARSEADQAHQEEEQNRIPALQQQVEELNNTMNAARETLKRAHVQAHERTVRPRLQEEIRNCIICHDRERSVAFKPCNHFLCCVACGQIQRQCPVCQARIQSRQQAIFS